MTKKILFLLTFLLTTLGGGQLWAVDTRTFTFETVPAHGTTETIGNISITFGSSSSKFDGKGFCDGTKYGLQGTKNTGADLDNHIPKTGENFYLNLSTYYPGRMSVNFYNTATSDPRGLTCYKQSTSNNSVTFVGSIDASASSMGTLEFDMEPGYNYYVYSVSNAPIYHEISFTPEAKPNTVDYSHTWLFEYDTKWPNTVGAMLTANNKWVTGGFEGRYQYMGTVNTSGGDALYDGNGNLVEETRGLKFNATNASDIQTELHYNLMLRNGASVIIPSAKIGQTVSIRGWWPSGKTISVANAKTSENANIVTGTGAVAEFVFTVTANADVTITVSDGNFFFYSISINKSELTTFAFNNTETYYGESGDSPSGNNKCTGEFIGRTTTFKYKVGRSQVLRTRVNVAPAFDVTGITVDNTNFGVSSNTSTVLDASSYSVTKPNDGKIWYWGVQVKKPGTASLTYRFNGTDAYNAKSYVQMITIEKDAPVLAFTDDFMTKTQGNPDFTNNLTLNGLSLPVTDDNAGTVYATYKSKNPSVATVDENTGQVSIVAPGVAIIEATVAESAYNNKVEKTYKLIVNPTSGTNPELWWNDNVSSVSVPYNQTVTHTATVNTSQTVHYESADPSIATVDDKGVVTGTGVGSTHIYALVDPTSEYYARQIEYTVTVTSAGELGGFRFEPNNGKVNNGYSITPKLAFPTIPASGVTSLKVTQIEVTEREGNTVSQTFTDNEISNCDIISVDAFDDLRNNWELDGVNKVFKVNVTIKGKKVGKARITVTFVSEYYNTATATYDVEVTQAGTTNFSWTEGGGSPEYYTYAGDFMMLPALTGNSNGNYNYSSGAKNSSSYTEGGVSHSALYAYEYERKWDGSKFNIKWNNKNIKIGEGFPDFAIVTDGISSPGTASVFFGRGEGSSHPDTLMVYCEKAGDVKLRAYDPQDHNKYCDATIHILPISNIEGSATTVTNGMTYPYTWDFTTDFNMDEMVGTTDQYWIPMKNNNGEATGDYTNGYGFFNLDWADTNKNNNTADRFYKYFIAGASSSSNTGYMHLFNGAMLQLKGSTSWANKMDRMRIYAYDSQNKKGRLGFIGGPHNVKLFLPESSKRPSSYKIIVKASGAGGTVNVNADESKNQPLSAEAKIVTFDSSEITTGSDNSIILGFADARVYWIAMSTEARTLMRPNNTTYAAATYSYNEDLDLIKSNEANGVTAYYASSFTVDKKDVSAGSTTGAETQYAVKMKPLTSLNDGTATYVTANKGILLKKNADGDANCYMIANPRNVDSYSAPETITGDVKNYLVGTGANSANIYGRGKDGDDDYTNFLMGYAYKYYTDVTDPNSGSEYRFDRDWSFYPLIVSGTYNLAAQRCYLKIPGNLYVDRNGNLVVMPSSSRRSAGESAEAPATKAALSIVFDDDPLTGQGTTGISTVATETTIDSDAWYTLQGVRVETPTKGGIYIHKGRKIVVK